MAVAQNTHAYSATPTDTTEITFIHNMTETSGRLLGQNDQKQHQKKSTNGNYFSVHEKPLSALIFYKHTHVDSIVAAEYKHY